jgi:hypothetical protein
VDPRPSAAKAQKTQQTAADKERKAALDARAQLEAKERECAELRREMDRASRANKAAETEFKTRDVRLNRALEDAERYKGAFSFSSSRHRSPYDPVRVVNADP